MKYCPYCAESISKLSKDHIFNDFLGGREKIDACRQCNNTFGHTFEAAASVNTLRKLYISIASLGLPLTLDMPVWKRAFEHEGLDFDLVIKNGSVQPQLSTPIVRKNKDGKVIEVIVNDQKLAEKKLREAQRNGEAPNGKIDKIQLVIPSYHSPFEYQIDDNLKLLAVKMCVALATRLPNFKLSEVQFGQSVLRGERPPDDYVTIDFTDYPSLDALREPLSHTIYVERSNRRVIGVVQFFGVVQLHCILGNSEHNAADAAILGSLDPITDDEQFNLIENPLKLLDPIKLLFDDPLIKTNHDKWLNKFKQSAIARGATKAVNLEGNLEVGV